MAWLLFHPASVRHSYRLISQPVVYPITLEYEPLYTESLLTFHRQSQYQTGRWTTHNSSFLYFYASVNKSVETTEHSVLYRMSAFALWETASCFRAVHPSVRPAVLRCPLTPISRDAVYLHVVEGFEWNMAQIFIMWVGVAENVFRGQRSTSNRKVTVEGHGWKQLTTCSLLLV